MRVVVGGWFLMTFGEAQRSVCSTVRLWPYGMRAYWGGSESLVCPTDKDGSDGDGLFSSQWSKDEPAEIM